MKSIPGFWAWASHQGCNWEGAANDGTDRGEDVGPGFHLYMAQRLKSYKNHFEEPISAE